MSQATAQANETTKKSAARGDEEARLGANGVEVEVLAFSGGAYDTVMQLGVLHAYLVTQHRLPDACVGISAGAVNAAIFADVLGQETLDARVQRFREIFEIGLQAPDQLIAAFLPDIYQVRESRPLEPADLPMFRAEEREQRLHATKARSGLINLLNDILRTRLSVAEITRIVYLALSFKALPESGGRLPWLKAVGLILWRAWLLVLRNWFGLVPTVGRVLSRLIWSPLSKGLGTARLVFSGGDVVNFRRLSSRVVERVIGFTALLWAPLPLVLVFLTLFLLRYGVGAKVISWIWIIGAVLIAAEIFALFRVSKHWLRLLQSYDIRDGVLPSEPLQDLLIRLLDPDYYRRLRQDELLGAALAPEGKRPSDEVAHRRVDWSATRAERRIHLGIVAANLGECRLETLPGDAPLVDALAAATAYPQLFKPVKFGAKNNVKYYVDATAITSEPTPAALNFVKAHVGANVGPITIHAVSPLPVSSRELAGNQDEYTGLISVAARATNLKRFCDATLGAKLTRLVNRALGPERYFGRKPAPADAGGGAGSVLLKARVVPIEPEAPLDTNKKIALAANSIEVRHVLEEAVATGCRATLQHLFAEVDARDEADYPTPTCKSVAERYQVAKRTTLQAAFPLSEGSPGCGLNEICRSCSLPPELRTAGAVTRPQRLRLRSRFEAEKKSPTSPAIPPTDPKVALVWSGGVFRGVFQIGAMAGLSVLRKPPKGADGVWPHLIAGASVGSITAAMNYALFRGAEAHRPTFIQRLATAFIVIDRLVVTDRFADFIRGTALRASDVRFSIREADRVFRRFDDAAGEQWSEEAREVLAGIERLFRVSPFETKALVEALRAGDNGRATKLCGDYFQWWLDRAGVGREVLGAEPLEHLIQDYVLAPLAETLQLRDQAAAASYPVCDLSRTGPAFLATATNLTAGRLELLGAPGPYKHAALLPSLLASSAFPGVFRPRWAWEVLAGAQQAVQFTDGGVMDNLPLDAACSRLAKEAEAGTVAWCPTAKGRAVPHLLFTVSLEPEVERLEGEALTRVASTWIDVQKRAGQFGYNHKIHAYAAAQTAIREIRAARRAEAPAPASDDVARERAQANAEGLRDLLDVEVLAITPLWTCGTFGFHPMLGFRQERQVENIAHGCKRTLETFREFDQMTEGQSRVHEGWMDAWGLNASTLSNWSQKADPTRAKGGCWYSPDIQCPFALATEQDHPASAEVRNAANRVYLACKKDTTHMPPEKRRRK